MSTRSILYLLVIAIVAGISALVGTIAGGVFIYSNLQLEQETPTPIQTETSQPLPASLEISTTSLEMTIIDAVEVVAPTVVTVVGEISGRPVSGSGVVISNEGYILTNNHVVEGVNRVVVILADGEELPAEIIGTDRYADLAILLASGELPVVAKLGNSDDLKPGETVIRMTLPKADQ